MPTRRLLPTAFAAALLSASLPALSQSAYTLSTLSKPSGATNFAPSTLDNLGVVRGGMYYAAGVVSGRGFTCILFCTGHLYRAVSWSQAPTALASATVGGKFLFPLVSNDKGTMVGPSSKAMEVQQGLTPPTYPSADGGYTLMGSLTNTYVRAKTTLLRQGSTDTDVVAKIAPVLGASNTTQFSSLFIAKGMNNSDAMVGLYDRPIATFEGGGTTYESESTAVVYRNGTVSRLDLGGYPRVLPADINDAGTVAGQVQGELDGRLKRWPALWVNERLSVVADNTLIDHAPVSINNAGQVLLSGTTTPPGQDSLAAGIPALRASAVVWFNGSKTPITSPAGEAIRATAMNDQGVVTGCALRYEAPSTVDARPFLWKNGALLDLTQELKAKGVSLPAGTKLGCPTAINNSGSILTYTYTNQMPSVITWVRINAKP